MTATDGWDETNRRYAYHVVHTPLIDHVCPQPGGFVLGTVIQCDDCGQHWEYQLGALYGGSADDIAPRWRKVSQP